MDLLLRPLRVSDEAEATAAHRELAAEGHLFLLGQQDGETWARFVARTANMRDGADLPQGWVATTYLVADVAGTVVGRVSIRHELNEFLATYGGHIGYAVRPAFRRRGYATEILRQALALARDSLGLERVLLTTDVDNAASAAVIERCGGVYEGTLAGDGTTPAKRRYWIECR